MDLLVRWPYRNKDVTATCQMAPGRKAAVRGERRGYDWSAEPTRPRAEGVSFGPRQGNSTG